jgi:hypothetical protein
MLPSEQKLRGSDLFSCVFEFRSNTSGGEFFLFVENVNITQNVLWYVDPSLGNARNTRMQQ